MTTQETMPITDDRNILPPLFFVEEITHRVLNEFSEAISALRIALGTVADTSSETALKSAMTRLYAHAEAHRALQPPRIKGPTNLATHITGLCACLTKAQLESKGVCLTLSADMIWLDAERCWRVGLIVAELIRNAAKHAFSSGPGAIRIEIAEVSGWISCQVIDGGTGGKIAGTGHGHRLIQALATELGGAVDWVFAPSGGCCARFEFRRSTGVDGEARSTRWLS